MVDTSWPTGVKRKWLRKKTFADKMAKCKLLAKDESDARWGMCWTPQTSFAIRLLIAFRLKTSQKDEATEERYFAFLTEEQERAYSVNPTTLLQSPHWKGSRATAE